jgi:hypothetical protein
MKPFPAEFLNVDLDIESTSDPAAIARACGNRVTQMHWDKSVANIGCDCARRANPRAQPRRFGVLRSFFKTCRREVARLGCRVVQTIADLGANAVNGVFTAADHRPESDAETRAFTHKSATVISESGDERSSHEVALCKRSPRTCLQVALKGGRTVRVPELQCDENMPRPMVSRMDGVPTIVSGHTARHIRGQPYIMSFRLYRAL